MKIANSSIPTGFLLSPDEQEAVRRQISYIASSPLFRNSKRFPDFLRYTVEEALEGKFGDLKERMIGIEVFGRDPNYDTNSDPVVRMTAVEVRKRLAQYYQTPKHEHELRIDFPRGSYVPEFRFPTNLTVEPPVAPPAPAPAPEVAPRSVAASFFDRLLEHKYLAVGAVVVVSIAAVLTFALGHFPARETAFSRFWSPFVNSSSAVLVCIPDLTGSVPPAEDAGAPAAAPSPTAAALATLPPSFRRNRVTFGDFFAASMLTGVLGSERRPFRLRRASDANLQDLEEGPVILIGGRHSNQWSLKLDDKLRFGLVHEGDLHYIGDRENPTLRKWSLTRSPNEPESMLANDYAIISRVFDPTTGHPLLTAAGLFQYGTEAAGMCLSSPGCLDSAASLAPGDWQHKNVQIVIATTIINENAGEPHVLAAYTW
jgi:hypothetical protein